MRLLRGNLDLSTAPEPAPLPVGGKELISAKQRTEVLTGAFNAIPPQENSQISRSSLLAIAQSSLSKVGSSRLENRRILELLPSVDKAARLMIASTLAPNDLTRQEIPIVFDLEGISETVKTRLETNATAFFQDKLNLKKSLPSWMYQFGYEAGAAVFATIPIKSFADIQEDSYVGTESLVRNVVTPLAQESLFGFSDTPTVLQRHGEDIKGIESLLVDGFLEDTKQSDDRTVPAAKRQTEQERKTNLGKFIELALGTESLSLTDNPSILQVTSEAKKAQSTRTKKLLSGRYAPPKESMIVSVPNQVDHLDELHGEPIFMRLPPEAVTVIHTPGDPNDHQGYLVLLDHTGNPLDAIANAETPQGNSVNYNENQGNIISQVYNAYGLGGQGTTHNDRDMMGRLYTQIVSEHLRTRLDKAGLANASVDLSDSVMRCMFGRFLQQKQTRVLFLPKELVSYMTFEKGPTGYGISRLDRIKFTLALKMTIQISRVLAALKAGMDKRKVTIDFTENMMENPEAIFQNVIREYLNKMTISFSVDPNVIQNQIADKSLSISGKNIPGMENFNLENEADTRAGVLDFDPTLAGELDKDVMNGLRIPAATMNSLDEDEYARSVTTTNLFFAMDVAIDQDVVIHNVSDLIRKYATYSEEFRKLIYEQLPSLGKASKTNNTSIESNVDLKAQDEDEDVPADLTLDALIDAMRITLPKPNVAPSKAQFEALTAMVESIVATVTSIMPDELVGLDDTQAATLRLIRAKYISKNIRAYLDSSGMSAIDIPENNFTDILTSVATFTDAVQNITGMLRDKANQGVPPQDETAADTGIPGY